MNLVWHIIKKDLRRATWVIVMWAVTGSYLLVYRKFAVVQHSVWDNLGIVSLFIHGALILALIAAIVQEDRLTEGNEFWRTRPISGGRLLVAKLALLLALLVVLPNAVVLGQAWLTGSAFAVADLRYVLPVMSVIVLSCAAMAACTKDLGRYFLGGVFCIMSVAMLGPWMVASFGVEPLSKAEQLHVETSKFFAIFGLCGVAAVIMLANQYFTRRTAVSIGIAVAAVVGVVLIQAFWRWSFIS